MRPRCMIKIRFVIPISSVKFIGNEDDADALFGEKANALVDLLLRAGVDAARRIVEHKRLQIALQPASQYDFLLIAAGQIPQRNRRRSRTNAELTDRGDRGGRAPSADVAIGRKVRSDRRWARTN